MLPNVTKVERQGQKEIVLHFKDNKQRDKQSKLVRRLARFVFTSSNSVSIQNITDYKNSSRTIEGKDIGGLLEIQEYLYTDGSNPFFDVTTVNSTPEIVFEATCRDSFYGFENETFVGKFEKIEVEVRSGNPSRGFMSMYKERLLLEVIVTDDQFQALFRHLWISPTPATINVAVSVPCFQSSSTGFASGPEDAVLDAEKPVAAQLDVIHVEKRLNDPAVEEKGDLPDTSPADRSPTIDALKEYAAQIVKSVKHIEIMVGILAGVVIAAVLFRL